MGGLDYYLPVMAMLLIQFIYAGINLGTRTVFLEGMNPRVLVVYRHAFATIVIAPIAYFSGYSTLHHHSFFFFVAASLLPSHVYVFNYQLCVSFYRRKTGAYYLNLRSFSLIFLISLVGITLSQNLYFEGIYLASASIVSAMANLVPAVTFIIAACLGMEKVNFGSLRFLAKVVGTVICVSGAVSMALLKGPKLLNAEKLPYNSILGSGNENWLLGCLSLVGCCIAWALWLILQVPASASLTRSSQTRKNNF
ncbi:hypothetical protein VNO77_08969 [Canavalia gladiata]|uniref:WAT1-related protein n=1 Tax=Canavalia gladiata TaxID=3824 RepID=A0AAN9QWT0_CANGL